MRSPGFNRPNKSEEQPKATPATQGKGLNASLRQVGEMRLDVALPPAPLGSAVEPGDPISSRNGVPQFLYKWVDGKQFQKFLDAQKLPPKRGYAHFIEGEENLVPGNSFTDEAHLDCWGHELDTLIRIDSTEVVNAIHPLPGNKTFLRTKGMTDNRYDPNCWKFESDEIDEFWVAGKLDLASAEIVNTRDPH